MTGPTGILKPMFKTADPVDIGKFASQSIVSVDVPKGSCFVSATTNLTSTGVDLSGCLLEANGVSFSDADWLPAANDSRTALVMQGVSVPATTNISVHCTTGGSVGQSTGTNKAIIPVN